MPAAVRGVGAAQHLRGWVLLEEGGLALPATGIVRGQRGRRSYLLLQPDDSRQRLSSGPDNAGNNAAPASNPQRMDGDIDMSTAGLRKQYTYTVQVAQ